MPIHLVIQEKRRALGLTQEQVAELLGVSAPAVNKWERGVSCPDIALLAPLARLLKTDLNTLLCFDAELSAQELERLCSALTRTQHEQGFAAAFELAQQTIRQYPHHDRLLFYFAQQLQGGLLIAGLTPEETARYDAVIMRYYEQLLQSSDDLIRFSVSFLLAGRYIGSGEYEKAKQLLDALPERKDLADKRMLQANLLLAQGSADEAETLLQGALLGAVNELQMLLFRLVDIALAAGRPDAAQYYAETSAAHARLYDLWDYSALVAQLQLAQSEQNAARAIDVLGQMLQTFLQPWQPGASPLYCRVASRPTDNRSLLPALVAELEHGDTLAFVREHPAFAALLAQYRTTLRQYETETHAQP